MQRRSLPTEFRTLDAMDNDFAGRGHSPSHSAFVEGLRERRPELFVDDVVVAAAVPHAHGGDATSAPAPVVPVAPVAITGFIVDAGEELTVDFGGIASPPSHDFPI
jgi:hypothetical protein